jgi:hypothetical protein
MGPGTLRPAGPVAQLARIRNARLPLEDKDRDEDRLLERERPLL